MDSNERLQLEREMYRCFGRAQIAYEEHDRKAEDLWQKKGDDIKAKLQGVQQQKNEAQEKLANAAIKRLEKLPVVALFKHGAVPTSWAGGITVREVSIQNGRLFVKIDGDSLQTGHREQVQLFLPVTVGLDLAKQMIRMGAGV